MAFSLDNLRDNPIERTSIQHVRDERGVVIAAVLSFLAIASALAIVLMAEGRAALMSAQIEMKEIQSRLHLDSAIERALAGFQINGDPLLEDLLRLKPLIWNWAGESIELDLDLESGKIDINKGHQDLLETAVRSMLGATEAQPVLQRIATARNLGRRIYSVSEILDAPLILTSQREKINKVLTVYTGSEGLDPLSMEGPIVFALSSNTSGNRRPLSFQLDHVSLRRPIYTLTARWKSEPERVRERRIVFVVRDNPRRTFVISWGDGDWYSQSLDGPAQRQ